MGLDNRPDARDALARKRNIFSAPKIPSRDFGRRKNVSFSCECVACVPSIVNLGGQLVDASRWGCIIWDASRFSGGWFPITVFELCLEFYEFTEVRLQKGVNGQETW